MIISLRRSACLPFPRGRVQGDLLPATAAYSRRCRVGGSTRRPACFVVVVRLPAGGSGLEPTPGKSTQSRTNAPAERYECDVRLGDFSHVTIPERDRNWSVQPCGAAWTSSTRTPPQSFGCRKLIREPIEPCRGVSYSGRTPVAAIASASA